MALDGEKLRRIRQSRGFSQEKLALMASVNKRNIQRAERGESVALETAAFIAEAIGVPAASLRGSQMELFEREQKAPNEVILVPTNSGRRIVDLLRSSFEAHIEFEVEPTNENIDLVAKLAALLEPYQPTPWETPPNCLDPTLEQVLRARASVNPDIPNGLSFGLALGRDILVIATG